MVEIDQKDRANAQGIGPAIGGIQGLFKGAGEKGSLSQCDKMLRSVPKPGISQISAVRLKIG
jgi:hypothetical protein